MGKARATFSRAVREELARRSEQRPCCRWVELSGLVRSVGAFHIRGGASDEEKYRLELVTSLQPVARMLYSYFKSLGPGVELLTTKEPRFSRRLLYGVNVPGSPSHLQALNELGVLSDSFRLEPGIPYRLLRKRCCRGAFLRGFFIGAGSMNEPSRPAHMELLTSQREFASDLEALLLRLEFHPGVYPRRGAHVVYLKGREEVAEFLALVGAHEAALALEEEAVVKEVRARANRVANCDEANLRRANRAADMQLDAIAFLERKGVLATVSPALAEAADLRRRFPHLGTAELAEEGGDGLSRSAMNHRLRRLLALARDVGFGERYGRIERANRSLPRAASEGHAASSGADSSVS